MVLFKVKIKMAYKALASRLSTWQQEKAGSQRNTLLGAEGKEGTFPLSKALAGAMYSVWGPDISRSSWVSPLLWLLRGARDAPRGGQAPPMCFYTG